MYLYLHLNTFPYISPHAWSPPTHHTIYSQTTRTETVPRKVYILVSKQARMMPPMTLKNHQIEAGHGKRHMTPPNI